MDDTCFDLLCKDLSADEARLFRKMLAEWSDGDENGFPVQLALLTRAQWRAAALVPQAVNESRKLIELHLAEYRRQTGITPAGGLVVGGEDGLAGATGGTKKRGFFWQCEQVEIAEGEQLRHRASDQTRGITRISDFERDGFHSASDSVSRPRRFLMS